MATTNTSPDSREQPISQAELMMHPVRFRVLMALSGQELTTRQIAAALPDISVASIYRHVHALHQGNLIHVVAEIPNRATVEKVFTQTTERVKLKPDPERSPDDFLRYFGVFTQAYQDQFRLYVRQPGVEPVRDGVSHWDDAVFLTPAERDALVDELSSVMSRYKCNQSTPQRVRFHVARIVIPESPRPDPDRATEDTKGNALS